jgi:tetratricopeptide (TPR) repeat protein
MMHLFKISLLILILFSLSCKTTRGTLSVYGETEEIIFRKKFHDANNEKLIGHFEKSIVLFNECIALKPEASASYFGLSKVYLQLKNTTKSIENAQKSYDLNTNNKWYVLHLAELYHSVGNYHKSAKYYDLLFTQFEEKNIDYRYQLAEALIYSEQSERAIDQLNSIELETGKTPELSLTKHDLYNDLGKSKEARLEIVDLLNEYPENVQIRSQILDYYLQTNQISTAETIAQQILDVDSTNGNAYLGLADIEIRKNNIDKSFDYLEKGFKTGQVNSERKLSLLNGLVQFAFDRKDKNSEAINTRLKSLFSVAEQEEADNPDFLSLYGNYLVLNNKSLEAREKFVAVCELNPSDYRAWEGLLNVDYDNSLFDSLFYDGTKAIEYYPSQPMVYLLTGIGAYESNRFDDAEELLMMGKDYVIQDDELKSEFEYQLGKAYWKSGDKIKGELFMNKAILIVPNNSKAYNGYAELLLKDNKLENALLQSNKAITISPKAPIYLNTNGTILLSLKKYTEALNVLERAIVIDYTNFEILENYGDALFLSGNPIDALEIWKESQKAGNNSIVLIKKIENQAYYEK